MPIEVAWTVGPALIVLILSLILSRTVVEVRADHDNPPPNAQTLRVTVVGRQWWWEYVYEEYDGKKLGIVTANELRVPVSDKGTPRPVYLTLKSADVVHSFWVPRLAGKTDCIPGRTNRMWFQARESGVFLGQCAEYCGTQHANMLLRVIVEPDADFRRWLDNEAKPAVEDPAVKKGRAAFHGQSCVNCHTVRGTPARGTFGPDLTHLMSRQTLLTGMVPNDREYLTRWVRDPQRIKQGCLMPAFRLSDSDTKDIVDYLLTLR
jgi:cytochrome c oxidase subunit II